MNENDIRCAGSTDTGAELRRKLDEANRRIAELESRTLTVTLPEPFYFYNRIQIKVLHYGLTVERLRAAGIRVSGEEPSSCPSTPDKCRCHNETGVCAELESALQELKRISEQPSVGTHYARVLHQHIASLNGELGAAKNHIAELESENGNLLTIANKNNELAISAQMDSNVAALEMRMLHKRLTELEAREARTYVPLPLNIEDEYRNHEYVAGWNDCRNAASVRQQTPAVCDVIAERYRQQSVEGWTSEHDDEHSDGELALAASCYAENFALFSTLQEGESVD
ncbi:hypothetical protein NCL57_004424 [Salmonella enterica]|nr:hypothetical protein [Salmonella enterica]